MDSRECSPFDCSIASEDSVATITQMDDISNRSCTPSTTTLTRTRRWQPPRPYRILAPAESVALLAAHNSQVVAAAKESSSTRRSSARLIKRKSKKEKSESESHHHISCPTPTFVPRLRCPLPRPPPPPACCPACDSAIGARLSAPLMTLPSSSPLSESFTSESEDPLTTSMASSVTSVKVKDEDVRLSYLSSSTGYSSARSSLRSSGEDAESPVGHSQSAARRSELLSRPQLTQLERICIELLDTERAFVTDLHDVIHGYLNYLVAHRDALCVTVDDICGTFGCIERIFSVNRKLYAMLDGAQLDAIRMCECFIDMAPAFDIYVPYCTNYQKMQSSYAALQSRSTVGAVLRERQASLGHSLPLNAYLLKPVQRILKYHLFIENMVRELESSGASDDALKVAKRALEEMRRQATTMNEEKKRSEHTDRVEQLQRALQEWARQQSSDLSAYGELILEATFKLAGAKTTRQLFLFEEMLLIAKQRNNQLIAKDYIMCSNLMLNESVSADPHAFQVLSFDSPRSQYIFLAASTEQKRTWMRELKRAMLDHYEVAIPEETKKLMLSMDNTQVKIPFGRPEFAEVKPLKKIPKYLEKRRKSVDARDRRRSLSTSRLAQSTSQNSTSGPSTPLPQCTCRKEPSSSSASTPHPSTAADYNDTIPPVSPSGATSPFSLFNRKKSGDCPPQPITSSSNAGGVRGRFFQARKARQLPPTGRDSMEEGCASPPVTPMSRSAHRFTSDEIERSFDEIYRNLQMFGAEKLPDKEDASRRLDDLVRVREERNEKRLRSKSLTRLDEIQVALVDEDPEEAQVISGWQHGQIEERIRKKRAAAAPLARFDHFDSGSPSPNPFSVSHPPYSSSSRFSSRVAASSARQRSPLSPEQCRMLDSTFLLPETREIINL